MSRTELPVENESDKTSPQGFKKPRKNIVIIGAGPIGLALAILLARRGVRNIAVVDPRAGEYSRSNDFLKEVFEFFSIILKIPIESTKERYIKDLENELLAYACTLEITFYKGYFMDINAESITISRNLLSEQNQTQTIAYDILFDCSGSRRCVVEAINKKFSPTSRENLFKICPIPSVATRLSFLFTQREMSGQDVIAFSQHQHTYDIKTLTALGWQNPCIPKSYANPLTEGTLLTLKTKSHVPCNLYAQAPPDLPEAKMKEWLKAILYMKTGMASDFSDEISLSKFEVTPCYTYPGYCVDEKDAVPMTFVLGDALTQPPFFWGSGTIFHLAFAYSLAKSLDINSDGSISLKEKEVYEKLYEDGLDRFKSEVLQFIWSYREENNFLDAKTDGDIEKYLEQLIQQLKAPDYAEPPSIKLHKLAQRLKQFCIKLKDSQPQKAKSYFKMILRIYFEHMSNWWQQTSLDKIEIYTELINLQLGDEQEVAKLAQQIELLLESAIVGEESRIKIQQYIAPLLPQKPHHPQCDI